MHAKLVDSVGFEYECLINSIEEYDHEIVLETQIIIDDMDRGWIGDLYYSGVGLALDNTDNITTEVCLKDVLCARITISYQRGSAVTWRYTFLKD